MKSLIQAIPTSNPSLHLRSFSKKHNSDYISPHHKSFHNRSVSKKSIIVSNYGYCPKDIQTIRDQNIKLKEQIQILKSQISQQKGLIISLQRLVATPQYRESISTQKEKQRLAERLRAVEKELNGIKKGVSGGSVGQIVDERNWYRDEVVRLKRLLLNKIRSNPSQSQNKINGIKQHRDQEIQQQQKQQLQQDQIKQSFIRTQGSFSKSKSTIRFLQPSQSQQNLRTSNNSQHQQRIKSTLSQTQLKRGFKDSIMVARCKIKDSTRNVLESLGNKLMHKSSFEGKNGGGEEKGLLPYNQNYPTGGRKGNRSFGSFRGKSIIERREGEEGKRSFVS